MGQFRYISPDEVAQRHRARNTEAPRRQERQAQYRNVEPILSLGDVRYVMYRSRAYRVPPVPFKLGQAVVDAHVRLAGFAAQVSLSGGQKGADAYYGEMARIAKLLWRHMRPTGRVKRIMWHVGLLQNPFRAASEREIKELVNFFLQGRMTSSVQPMVGKTEVS